MYFWVIIPVPINWTECLFISIFLINFLTATILEKLLSLLNADRDSSSSVDDLNEIRSAITKDLNGFWVIIVKRSPDTNQKDVWKFLRGALDDADKLNSSEPKEPSTAILIKLWMLAQRLLAVTEKTLSTRPLRSSLDCFGDQWL